MAGDAALTLDEVLDALGLPSLRVLTPGVPRDAPVSAVVVEDPWSLDDAPAGALALVPGVSPDAPDLGAALRRAAAAGTAAVVLRDSTDGGHPAGLDGSPVPVLGLATGLGWGELYELLASALASSERALRYRVPPRAAAPLLAFADAAALALGGAVSLEDAQGHVLAYSTVEGQSIDREREQVILARRVPLTRGNRADYERLARADGPIHFDAYDDVLSRLAIAVRGRSDPRLPVGDRRRPGLCG